MWKRKTTQQEVPENFLQESGVEVEEPNTEEEIASSVSEEKKNKKKKKKKRDYSPYLCYTLSELHNFIRQYKSQNQMAEQFGTDIATLATHIGKLTKTTYVDLKALEPKDAPSRFPNYYQHQEVWQVNLSKTYTLEQVRQHIRTGNYEHLNPAAWSLGVKGATLENFLGKFTTPDGSSPLTFSLLRSQILEADASVSLPAVAPAATPFPPLHRHNHNEEAGPSEPAEHGSSAKAVAYSPVFFGRALRQQPIDVSPQPGELWMTGEPDTDGPHEIQEELQPSGVIDVSPQPGELLMSLYNPDSTFSP